MFVGLSVSELDDKHSNSVIVGVAIFIFDYNFCEDGRMVGKATHVSGPPFCGCLGWSVQIETICLFVKSSSRLNSSNVRSMAYFRLSVASVNIEVSGQWNPSFSLLLIAELVHGLSEHGHVETDHRLAVMSEVPSVLRMVALLEIHHP